MEANKKYYITRLIISFIGTTASALFVALGWIALRYDAFFGVGYLVIGLIGVWACLTYGIFGGRLGVTMDDNALVIHHYHSRKVVPLSRISHMLRSDESTTLYTLDGDVDISHTLLVNQDENLVFDKLQQCLNRRRNLSRD